MHLRSLIVTIVALFVIANVIVAGMRRCGVVPAGGEGPARRAGSLATEPSGAGPIPSLSAPAEVSAAAAAPAPSAVTPRPPVGIDGLHLQLSRPLMFDVGELGGLATHAGYLYVAAWDGGSGVAVLYQVNSTSYTITQVRALHEDGAASAGGIDAGDGQVWVPLGRGGEAISTVVLAIEAETLEVRQRFEVAMDLAAVAAGDDGRVYGVSRDGALWAEWLPDGTMVRQVSAAGGARYADLARAGGSLVAGGTDGVRGVIDVIDPKGFTLLARRYCAAEGSSAAWVTSGGLEVGDGTVLLLPEGGARPSLLTYVPEGGEMAAFAPSVEGVGR